MKALLSLVLLSALPASAHAGAECSLDRVGISVMITSEVRGPIGNFDAGSNEDSQGRNSCAGYLADFRAALRDARLQAAKDCAGAIDNVDLASVQKAALANPARRVLGAEFPEACR